MTTNNANAVTLHDKSRRYLYVETASYCSCNSEFFNDLSNDGDGGCVCVCVCVMMMMMMMMMMIVFFSPAFLHFSPSHVYFLQPTPWHPPHFSLIFPILRDSERVLYSAHTYALSGCSNIPTNRPIRRGGSVRAARVLHAAA